MKSNLWRNLRLKPDQLFLGPPSTPPFSHYLTCREKARRSWTEQPVKLNSWPPPPPITAMLMISSLQISKTQNATLKYQQFLASLLSVMCERVSAPTQFWTSTASTVLLLLLGLEPSWLIRINIKHLNLFCKEII